MRRGRTSSMATETQDAYFAIEQFTVWINSADSKAGFLSAALAIVVNGMVLEWGSQPRGLRHLSEQGAVAAVAFCLSVLCALACTGTLLLAIYPRVRQHAYSRYSWPSVAQSAAQATTALTPIASRREAWATARLLALIARQKYRYLRFSFICWIASLAWLLLAVLAS
jgi:hypothetical protein